MSAADARVRNLKAKLAARNVEAEKARSGKIRKEAQLAEVKTEAAETEACVQAARNKIAESELQIQTMTAQVRTALAATKQYQIKGGDVEAKIEEVEKQIKEQSLRNKQAADENKHTREHLTGVSRDKQTLVAETRKLEKMLSLLTKKTDALHTKRREIEEQRASQRGRERETTDCGGE
eukprot:GHVU01012073.1.p1 GENE.GHVU01012073.1~~GHVU01012073.1.p1  ORF type:complete len:179 (+),score=47.80 GHVU01012073.1:2061-2597(+)